MDRTPEYPDPEEAKPGKIGIPASKSIAELRESFMDFCDNLNLDAVLEPLKS